MTLMQKRLVNNYTILVMGKRYITDEEYRINETQLMVPDTAWELADGTNTTLRFEVRMEVAMREIAVIG